ncbi:unnamed protein product [Prorocentrum cordatum]|uniref:Mannosyltransferase n=1 Tax=Prorocentrum cordatum TaxID=2364126 RepID=A0ABN9V2G9_9DINO|nr:unnamed protein product [Polarella glacialis]
MRLPLLLVVLRLVGALVLRTSFGPDEQWQSLEVAHRWAFGYGHLTWEWERCVALRGVLHPALFAAFYTALRAFGADAAWLVAYGPRMLQGLAAAAADLAVYRTAEEAFGAEVALWSLAAQLGSWFLFYCMPRTFSNSLEAVLMALALQSWLRRGAPARRTALLLGSLCVALRPTAGLFWLALALHEVTAILTWPGPPLSARVGRAWSALVAPGLLISVMVLTASSLMDFVWYESFTFVPWNHFRFNLLRDQAIFYGSHPWHWYLTEGLAVTLGTFLPFVLAGAWFAARGLGKCRALRGPVAAASAAIAALSLASHKEYRFLLPYLPLASLLAGTGLARAVQRLSARPRLRWAVLALVFLPQALAMAFFARVHQRGADAVLGHLRARAPGPRGAFFLTACHATPLHSYLHRDVPLGYLDCSPGQGSPRDRLFRSPLPVLRDLFPRALHPEAPPGAAAGVADGGAGSPADPCLAARYDLPALELPEVFVVWGGLLVEEPSVAVWLANNSFSLEFYASDGYFSEGPYGMDTNPHFLVYRLSGTPQKPHHPPSSMSVLPLLAPSRNRLRVPSRVHRQLHLHLLRHDQALESGVPPPDDDQPPL